MKPWHVHTRRQVYSTKGSHVENQDLTLTLNSIYFFKLFSKSICLFLKYFLLSHVSKASTFKIKQLSIDSIIGRILNAHPNEIEEREKMAYDSGL